MLRLWHAGGDDTLEGVIAARAVREAYRREVVPERVLWWLAAAGMRDWYRVLGKRLGPHFPERDTRELLARLSVRMFERRWDALRAAHELPDCRVDSRAVGLLMAALYRVNRADVSGWIFAGLGGPARSASEHLRARLMLRRLGVRARWDEVATHLGELLIVLTEDLPAHLPHARKILGDICFEAALATPRT